MKCKEWMLRRGIGFIVGLIFGIIINIFIISMLTKCSFDYDTDYINEPPDTIIGTPCYNLGDQIKYTYGQYYYCAECTYDIDSLRWSEMDCSNFEGE